MNRAGRVPSEEQPDKPPSDDQADPRTVSEAKVPREEQPDKPPSDGGDGAGSGN